MKYALLDNKRIEPQKGIKNATCPVCNEPVTPRCGDMRVHHWAHRPNSNCDPWWESETEWHRQWKNNFPEDYQEYIMHDSKSNEKHIADVRTNTGFVLEFQHSYMPREEQKSREQFYKNMVWIVDARGQYEKFKKHIELLNHIQKNRAYFYIKIKSWEENPKCFSEKWLNSSVPIIFDFGIHEKDENEKYKNWLWCIFSERYKKRVEYDCNNVLCGVCLKKEKFIEWVCKHENFLPNLVLTELEEIHKKYEAERKIALNKLYEEEKKYQKKISEDEKQRQKEIIARNKIKCEEETAWRECIEKIRKNMEKYKLKARKIFTSDKGEIIDRNGEIYTHCKSMTLAIKSSIAKWKDKEYNKNEVLMLVEHYDKIITAIANIPDFFIEDRRHGKYNYYIRNTTTKLHYGKFKIYFEDDEKIYLTKKLKEDLQYIKEKFETN